MPPVTLKSSGRPELSENIYAKIRKSYRRTHGLPSPQEVTRTEALQSLGKGYHMDLVSVKPGKQEPAIARDLAEQNASPRSSRRFRELTILADDAKTNGKKTKKQHMELGVRGPPLAEPGKSKRKRLGDVVKTNEKTKKTKKSREPELGIFDGIVKWLQTGGSPSVGKAETVVIQPDGNILSDRPTTNGKPVMTGGAGLKAKTGKTVMKGWDEPVGNYKWGLGVEHEMQLFHQGHGDKGFEHANIIFDSQESTCFITGDPDKVGACCKLGPGGQCYYHPKSADLRRAIFKKRDQLTKEERAFLLSLDWELTGRQVRGCKPNPVIVPRTPVLMPELVTGNYRNRTINSIAAESVAQEEMYIRCQMKNPFTREKVNKYGPLVTHLCGTLDNIKVPRRPTILERDYTLETGMWKDYVGSYHVTITLPHTEDISQDAFIKMHQNMACAIQWIEPLLATAFFSPDPSIVGKGHLGIEGSFRVAAVGWGNFAGADVRKLGTEGIGRGAVQETYWRKNLDIPDLERVNQCVKTAPPQYKKAVSILTSDFRTFGYEPDMEKCKRDFTPGDCPKTDGGPMRPPFGMEIRIFDHFPSEYLLDLMKILVLVGANSARHPPRGYVYKNTAWIKAVKAVMTGGWNAKLGTDYLTEIRRHLGIDLRPVVSESRLAWDLLVGVVDELHRLNQSSHLVHILDETPDVKPRVPQINRQCWQLSFNQKYFHDIMRVIKEDLVGAGGLNKGIWYPVEKVAGSLYGVLNKSSPGEWSGQIDDLLYALQAKHRLALKVRNGKINKIKII
jgi:hypothetical protein